MKRFKTLLLNSGTTRLFTRISVFSSIFSLFILLPPPSVMALDLAEMQEMATRNREIIKRYQAAVEKGTMEVKRSQSGYYPRWISDTRQTDWMSLPYSNTGKTALSIRQ